MSVSLLSCPTIPFLNVYVVFFNLFINIHHTHEKNLPIKISHGCALFLETIKGIVFCEFLGLSYSSVTAAYPVEPDLLSALQRCPILLSKLSLSFSRQVQVSPTQVTLSRVHHKAVLSII